MDNDPKIQIESDALTTVLDPEQWVCLLCKKAGLPLEQCFRKMASGKTSNPKKYLKDINSEDIEAIEKTKSNKSRYEHDIRCY